MTDLWPSTRNKDEAEIGVPLNAALRRYINRAILIARAPFAQHQGITDLVVKQDGPPEYITKFKSLSRSYENNQRSQLSTELTLQNKSGLFQDPEPI